MSITRLFFRISTRKNGTSWTTTAVTTTAVTTTSWCFFSMNPRNPPGDRCDSNGLFRIVLAFFLFIFLFVFAGLWQHLWVRYNGSFFPDLSWPRGDEEAGERRETCKLMLASFDIFNWQQVLHWILPQPPHDNLLLLPTLLVPSDSEVLSPEIVDSCRNGPLRRSVQRQSISSANAYRTVFPKVFLLLPNCLKYIC